MKHKYASSDYKEFLIHRIKFQLWSFNVKKTVKTKKKTFYRQVI